MKKLIKIALYTSLMATSALAMADSAVPMASDQAAPVAPDPTRIFFTSLQKCVPGNYQEKNILATNDDEAWLNQQIVGIDEQGYCHAILQTPDSRKMPCYFDPYDLADLGSARFLNGMSSLDDDPTSKAGISAEQQWSQLKDQNCSISHE